MDEFCAVGKPESDPAPNMHCTCWYEGDGRCRCKAPGMTGEQKLAQGMI